MKNESSTAYMERTDKYTRGRNPPAEVLGDGLEKLVRQSPTILAEERRVSTVYDRGCPCPCPKVVVAVAYVAFSPIF